MKGTTGIGHVAIRAKDFAALHAFYTEKLGFEELMRLHRDNGDLWLVYYRITDTQYLELFPEGTGEGPLPPSHVGVTHICLTTENLDETVADLAARGVPLTSGPKTGADGNQQAWIADPEGNRFELMEMAPTGLQAQAIAQRSRP